ncbi:hypothetical protein KAJ38_02270 [Candidatus Pacearchaeota archaeon]|nr:hypothetical protein [Candidatus Pacearchaeota archaeon]
MITGMVTTITDVLNIWNDLGVFSYMIPFLLLFAVVFAILEKSEVLGTNKSIMSIVAASIGLLALQFDFVSEFFAVIFPRFGVGISIFLVLIIMIGFFFPKAKWDEGKSQWIGWVVGIGVVLWAISDWDRWSSYSGFGGWFNEYFWSLIVLGVLIGVIVWLSNPSPNRPTETTAPRTTV